MSGSCGPMPAIGPLILSVCGQDPSRLAGTTEKQNSGEIPAENLFHFEPDSSSVSPDYCCQVADRINAETEQCRKSGNKGSLTNPVISSRREAYIDSQ